MKQDKLHLLRELKKDNRGVFGLSSVQSFFAIILGVALLAFVIVVIMGTLQTSTIVASSSSTINNETNAFINQTGYTLSGASNAGAGGFTILTALNGTSGVPIQLTNISVTSAGVVRNVSAAQWDNVNISYSFTFTSPTQTKLNTIAANTSTGITSFFGAINPVYAILAVLVIILVLVVLVRVVTGGTSGNAAGSSYGGFTKPSQL